MGSLNIVFFPKEYDRQRIHWPYAACPTVSDFVRTVYHQSTEGGAGIPVVPKSQIPNTTCRHSLPTSRLPVMFFFLLIALLLLEPNILVEEPNNACGKSNGQRVMRNGIWDWDLGFETGIPAQISQQKMWQNYEK